MESCLLVLFFFLVLFFTIFIPGNVQSYISLDLLPEWPGCPMQSIRGDRPTMQTTLRPWDYRRNTTMTHIQTESQKHMTDTKPTCIIDQIIGRLALPVVPLQLFVSPSRIHCLLYLSTDSLSCLPVTLSLPAPTVLISSELIPVNSAIHPIVGPPTSERISGPSVRAFSVRLP
ncbi:hypothetical protein BDV38DRAFT_234900 [Aspergillus pseudotamarii]|uniref:Secreted protein n=1 Tax=Aspergillus pseudotamarii TaxID=132259 RepID=A0A5N6T7Z5_ASPPS|nr:uncharacterized protein BDV38DRAFT_234900 [Aspergillus pseudotamarii]KAE8142498.1 hypothetical protein BDV38DRAFT_234900 [Aspergillus pseudotamarii]